VAAVRDTRDDAVTPEEVVRAELAAWSRLEADEIVSYFAPDAVWDNVPFGPVRGHEEIRKMVEGFLGRMSSAQMDVLNLVASGNIVVTERVDHLGIDGRTLDARCMGIFEIAGDKITAWRDYFDMSHGSH
jgi:limonene-1,2-epoxide hydrolase